MLFNGVGQGELNPSPEKILFWIIDLKITVINEIIAIKAKAELKADQPNTIDEEAFILRG
ncbi:MAG: hypothetical protein D3922_07770 [Candidatus Electrothrix sp. AR1]|nr:hypothetical protein [Candidatus Electrothrix sp. AR1]